MTDPLATTSSSEPSKRQAEVLELGDPNPKPSKMPKTSVVAPIHEPEEVCAEAKHICSNQHDYITSRAMSHDEEIVGKDKDSASDLFPQRSSTTDYLLAGPPKSGIMTRYKPTRPNYEPAVICGVPKDWIKTRHLKRVGFANLALSHYNNTNSTKYVLVEDGTIDSYFFVDAFGKWIHCCFYAMDSSNQHKQVNVEDAPIKLQFFAEIKFPYPLDPIVTKCVIIEGETKVGCENCQSVNHPVVGYRTTSRGNIVAPRAMLDEEDPYNYREPPENELE